MIGAIIAGAMEGAGNAGKQIGDYWTRSELQKQADEAMAARESRLSELRKGELEFAEDLRTKNARAAGAEIDTARSRPAYDQATDSVRPRTPAEERQLRTDIYRRHGMVPEAQREEEMGSRIEDRTTDNLRADRQQRLAEQQFDVTKRGADLDAEIKRITLANTQRVEKLREEFRGANPARQKQITEEIQLLTGKDNDSYIPVPVGYDEATGKPNAYRIFDRKRNAWADDQPGGAQPSADDIAGLRQRANNPQAIAFFENKFGKGAAAKYLQSSPTPQEPTAPGTKILPPSATSNEPSYARYVTQRRGGVVIDAPARSVWSKLNGRTFGNRQEALDALAEIAPE